MQNTQTQPYEPMTNDVLALIMLPVFFVLLSTGMMFALVLASL